MQVWVEEEYGYADYIWDPPFNTHEDFINWWERLDKTKIRKAVFEDVIEPPSKIGERNNKTVSERRIESYRRTFGGEWEQIEYSTDFQPSVDRLQACDAYMHVHEEFDSYITVMTVPGEHWKKYESGIPYPEGEQQ